MARFEFASDNTAGVCPEALAALEEASHATAASYAEDSGTERLRKHVRELFECERCEVFLVFNGTAANALALAQVCRPFHSVLCHEHAHIENDECGAVEFFSGGSKLIPTRGGNGKLDLREVEAALARQHEVHSHKPRVLSLTQATELGTVYGPAQIAEMAAFTRARHMLLHMDGARFANAVAALGCAPKEISWQAGVDVLCFGGTKNGLAAGELVIFFDPQHAIEFEYRVKQGGQLASKTRLLAAPWLALFESGAWLRNAAHANASAATLAKLLAGAGAGADVVFPVESNALFLRLNDGTVAELRGRGWQFYKFIEPDVYRLMCSWATTHEQIGAFVRDFASVRGCAQVAA